jgi:hypothetical protein
MNGMYESLPFETKNLSWDEYKASKEQCRTYPQSNYENSLPVKYQKNNNKIETKRVNTKQCTNQRTRHKNHKAEYIAALASLIIPMGGCFFLEKGANDLIPLLFIFGGVLIFPIVTLYENAWKQNFEEAI